MNIDGGINIVLQIQEFRIEMLGTLIDNLLYFVSSPLIYLYLPFFIIAGMFWCMNKRAATCIAMSFLVTKLLADLIKYFLAIPRPWLMNQLVIPSEKAIEGAPGFSCPSGHTAVTASFWGLLAIIFRKTFILPLLCLIPIIIIPFSRIYLGVHTPLDIILGLLTAALGIGLSLKVTTWLEKNPKMDWIIALSGYIFILLSVIFLIWRYLLSPEWAETRIAAATITSIIGCGYYAGFITGWLIERHWINYEINGGIVQRLIIFSIGSITLLGLLYYLKRLLSLVLTTEIAGFCANFFITLFIFAVYPWILQWRKTRVSKYSTKKKYG
ncbi:MAG TPA: phosphatase PAP2 family protein [Methanocorpusculum sp.]|nr:phosphatase PAP2 family protein [Methanocorpusculum sp.]